MHPKMKQQKKFLQVLSWNLYQDEIYIFTPKGEFKKIALKLNPRLILHFEIHKQCWFLDVSGQK